MNKRYNYVYTVMYDYFGDDYSGAGNMSVERPKPLKLQEQINVMSEYIGENFHTGPVKVIVTDYKLLYKLRRS